MHVHERFGVTTALPYPRAQGSGHITVLSSMLGVAAFPATGGYPLERGHRGLSTPWPRSSLLDLSSPTERNP